jgi:hypothetical protein
MSHFQTLFLFKKQMLLFFDEMIQQFPFEADFQVLKLFIQNQIPIETCAKSFQKFLNKNEGSMRVTIKERNDVFFFEKNLLKFVMSDEKFDHFKKLWFDSSFSTESKAVVWSWIDVFIRIVDKIPTDELN